MTERSLPLFSDETQSFLRHWFEGFSEGLEQLDPLARDALLSRCAAACGRSFTAAAFCKVWAEAAGELDRFLTGLSVLGTKCRRTGTESFEGTWDQCGCDLVTAGLMKTPLLCRCSEHSLRQNLEAALGRPATVILRSTILGGAERCVFDVFLR